MSGWQVKPAAGLLTHIAVAKGGGIVLAVNNSGQLLRWNGVNNWAVINAPVRLADVAIGSTNDLYALTAAGEIYRWRPGFAPEWAKVEGNLKSITVGVDGTVGGMSQVGPLVRTADDVNAEILGRKTGAGAGWSFVGLPIKEFELVNASTAFVVDAAGMIAKDVEPEGFAKLKTVLLTVNAGNLILLPTSLVTSQDIKLVTDPQPLYLARIANPSTTSNCVLLDGSLKVTPAPGTPASNITMIPLNSCVTGKFRQIRPLRQPVNPGNNPLPLFLKP